MNEDMKLAVGILADASRPSRSFERRFGDAMQQALEHCRTAVDLGLSQADYSSGVAQAAARSLLSSIPAEVADAKLDPHVSRILGHRDFGLALLLKRGREDAWQAFAERFGSYIRSLFIRSGRTSDDARDLLLELVQELRGEDGQVGAIAEYRGRSDLQNWLFCYVRGTFRGGMAATVEAERAPADIAPTPGTSESDEEEALALEVGSAFRQVFKEQWEAVPPRDQKLIEILAAGGSSLAIAASGILAERNRSPDAAQLLARHRQILEDLFDKAFWKLVEHFRDRMRAPEVEAALHQCMTAELEAKLMPVLGIAEEPRS